jgi:hypothetical protein
MIRLLPALSLLLWLPWAARAAEAPPSPAEGVVLNTSSFWRCHLTLRPPVFGPAAAAKPGPARSSMPATQPWSPLPPADWTRPEFDDAAWWRQPAPFPGLQLFLHDSYMGADTFGTREPQGVALLCVRGRFGVEDPAAARDLTLTATFRGGLVAYLNGREFLRQNMPAGALTPETLAEDYPAEIFQLPDRDPGKTPEGQAKLEARLRKVTGVAIPKELLRKGANVLALEIHRSARLGGPVWNPCALVEVELKAAGGVTPNIARPRGKIQIWNANIAEDVTDVDYGDPCEALGPIRIVGARGGVFTGQVVVGSDGAIKGLKVGVSSLTREGGKETIPEGRIAVYYPKMEISASHQNLRYPVKGTWKPLLCGISDMKIAGSCPDAPPPEVPVRSKGTMRDGYPYVWGAVQPVWVSVSVPREAPPGVYAGVLKVSAAGLPETSVPVRVTVCAWTLPPPTEFASCVDFVQSPDGLARQYKVPLWSEKHFQLMGRTFELLGQVGNRTLYVPAILPTHFGNAETMIRWVKNGDGKYKYDFTVLEKYLETAEKHMGKPQVVCVYLWDVYLGGVVDRGTGGMGPHAEKFKETTVGVTVVDPATGKTETVQLPAYGPEAETVWAPFARALTEFMTKRGLMDAMLIGMAGDIRPRKDQVEFWKKLLPETKWMVQGHNRADSLYGVPVAYSTSVFGCQFPVADPEVKRTYGWQRPNVTTIFPRVLRVNSGWNSGMFYRLLMEWNVAGNQNGVGRIAADFFPEPRCDPKASWGNAGLRRPWLTAGADGAVPSSEYLLLREGIQECEARIFVEKALVDEAKKARLGAALAEKCQKLLDERTRCAAWVFDQMYLNYNLDGAMLGKPLDLSWFAGSGWQERNERLYAAAAEVAGKLGAK